MIMLTHVVTMVMEINVISMWATAEMIMMVRVTMPAKSY